MYIFYVDLQNFIHSLNKYDGNICYTSVAITKIQGALKVGLCIGLSQIQVNYRNEYQIIFGDREWVILNKYHYYTGTAPVNMLTADTTVLCTATMGRMSGRHQIG